MINTLQEFAQLCCNPYERLVEYKNTTGQKIIGCLPMYVPEELIHAAGMLPVAIVGGEEPVTLANRHLMTHSCELVRSSFDLALKGKMACLDGLVNPLLCDQLRFFSDVWFLDTDFSYKFSLWLPYILNETSRSFLIKELRRFKSSLEEFSGREISPAALHQSIQIYNENRARLRKLYDLRRNKPGLIRARDMVRIISAGMFISKEEHNRLLDRLLAEIDESGPPTNQVKVVVVGHPCAIPEESVLDLIEEVGAVIVDDDFYFGGRYVAYNVKAAGDPLAALAERYMQMIPCTCKHKTVNYLNPAAPHISPDYSDFVVDLWKNSDAHGVIILRVMYCDPYDFEYPILINELDRKNIPFISVITEHEMGSLEPIKTRLQGFVEMIKDRN